MERVLTLRDLNRTTLERQLLLRRGRLRVAAAVERLGALQAQWPPSPFVALWSRLDAFRRDELERALRRDAVVKATLMRATLHLVSRRDYPFFAAAVRDAQVAARTRGVEPPSDEKVERARELARGGPVTRRDLYSVLGHDPPPRPAEDPRPLRELHWLIALARLEQSPECAYWSPPHITTFRVLDADEPPREQALPTLARRYFAAFGPASRRDLAAWSGVPLRDLDPALATLPLRRLRDENGRELLDLARAPIVLADAPAPVRLLPAWDEVLLAYDARERILPFEYRPRVIERNGDVKPTCLVDGFVAGIWTLTDGRVEFEPFAPLPRRARTELAAEARRLEEFVR